MKFALSTEPRASQQYGTIAAPRRAFLIVAWLMAMCGVAFAQGTPRQGGAWSGGRVPMYVGSGSGTNPTVQDSGPASGGGVGVGVSEFGMTARGTGTPPYVGQGTGPYGTNFCNYDAPITNATGYHYLCMTPNSDNGKGLIAFGAGGIATPTALQFIINGSTYDFPISVGGITGPGSSTVGHAVTWNNTAGSLVADAGFAPMNAADNLSTLANMVTSRKNLGLGCPTGNGPNTTTAGSVIGVFASCFGVLTDGVSDDTAAWNAAIVYANAHAGTKLIANVGTSVITSLNTFTADNSYIICVSGPGDCVLSHSGSPGVTFTGVASGGLVNMGLNNTGAACNVTVMSRGGSFGQFYRNLRLGTGIGTLAQFGISVAEAGGTSSWSGLQSPRGVANVNCPLFDLKQGFSLSIQDSLLFVTAQGVAGRHLIRANLTAGASWDSFTIVGNFFQFFDSFLFSSLSNTSLLIDGLVTGNFFGNCSGPCISVSTNTGSSFSTWQIENNWFDQNASADCLVFGGTSGNIAFLQLIGNRINFCGSSGVLIGGGSTTVYSNQVMNNSIFGINLLGVGTTYGISLIGSGNTGTFADNIVSGNMVAPQNPLSGFTKPSFGISVAATPNNTQPGAQRALVTGNTAVGSILNYFFDGIFNDSQIYGNIGISSATSSLAVGASPFTYTSGPQPETIFMYGGTINAVAQNAVQVCGTGGCTVNLAPNESVTIYYTVLPTVSKTVH